MADRLTSTLVVVAATALFLGGCGNDDEISDGRGDGTACGAVEEAFRSSATVLQAGGDPDDAFEAINEIGDDAIEAVRENAPSEVVNALAIIAASEEGSASDEQGLAAAQRIYNEWLRDECGLDITTSPGGDATQADPGSTSTSEARSDESQVIERNGYRFETPSGWRVEDRDGEEGTGVLMISEDSPPGQPGFSNEAFAFFDNGTYSSPDEYIDTVMTLEKTTVESRKDMSLEGGVSAVRVNVRGDVDGDPLAVITHHLVAVTPDGVPLHLYCYGKEGTFDASACEQLFSSVSTV